MINKLRKKLILIIMSLVSLILIFVLTALCVTSYNQNKEQTIQALEIATEMRNERMPLFEIGRDEKQEQPSIVPSFSVTINDENDIIFTNKETVEVSDEDIAQAVGEALALNSDSGVIRDLDLRYLIRNNRDGRVIAFADMSNEISSTRNMVFSACIIFFVAEIAFLIVSIFLSRLAVRPVEMAFKRQQQFIADASHELKTPLTVILANTEILMSNSDDTVKNQMKWLENTRDESKRMKRLVEDMLFLAKSDYIEGDFQLESINFSDLVWRCVLPFEAVAFEADLKLISEIDQNIYILGNAEKLRQLVGILLDNACKYSGIGEEVTVRLFKEQSKTVLKVINTGSVIKNENIEHVFDRFFREDKARTGGGYGLGLAIASEITEKSGGKITVKSSKETGTVFTVKFNIYNKLSAL